jgi:hypothetical protein
MNSKLVPRALDKGPRPKSVEAKHKWHLFWRGKSIGPDQKNNAKRRAPDLENQESC